MIRRLLIILFLLSLSPDMLSAEVVVRWGGKGFDPDTPSAGMGLKTMRERAGAVNGKLSITSAKGQGTVIEAAVPLADN